MILGIQAIGYHPQKDHFLAHVDEKLYTFNNGTWQSFYDAGQYSSPHQFIYDTELKKQYAYLHEYDGVEQINLDAKAVKSFERPDDGMEEDVFWVWDDVAKTTLLFTQEELYELKDESFSLLGEHNLPLGSSFTNVGLVNDSANARQILWIDQGYALSCYELKDRKFTEIESLGFRSKSVAVLNHPQFGPVLLRDSQWHALDGDQWVSTDKLPEIAVGPSAEMLAAVSNDGCIMLLANSDKSWYFDGDHWCELTMEGLGEPITGPDPYALPYCYYLERGDEFWQIELSAQANGTLTFGKIGEAGEQHTDGLKGPLPYFGSLSQGLGVLRDQIGAAIQSGFEPVEDKCKGMPLAALLDFRANALATFLNGNQRIVLRCKQNTVSENGQDTQSFDNAIEAYKAWRARYSELSRQYKEDPTPYINIHLQHPTTGEFWQLSTLPEGSHSMPIVDCLLRQGNAKKVKTGKFDCYVYRSLEKAAPIIAEKLAAGFEIISPTDYDLNIALQLNHTRSTNLVCNGQTLRISLSEEAELLIELDGEQEYHDIHETLAGAYITAWQRASQFTQGGDWSTIAAPSGYLPTDSESFTVHLRHPTTGAYWHAGMVEDTIFRCITGDADGNQTIVDGDASDTKECLRSIEHNMLEWLSQGYEIMAVFDREPPHRRATHPLVCGVLWFRWINIGELLQPAIAAQLEDKNCDWHTFGAAEIYHPDYDDSIDEEEYYEEQPDEDELLCSVIQLAVSEPNMPVYLTRTNGEQIKLNDNLEEFFNTIGYPLK